MLKAPSWIVVSVRSVGSVREQIIGRIPRTYNIEHMTFDKTLKPKWVKPWHQSPPSARCSQRKASVDATKAKLEQPTLYEQAMIKHVRKMFSEHAMIAFCAVVPAEYREFRAIRGRMALDSLHYGCFDSLVMNFAIQGTIMESLKPLFLGKTGFIVSKTPNFGDLMKHLKKCRTLTLLACIADHQVLTAKDVMYLASVSSSQQLPIETSSLLSTAVQRMPQLIMGPAHSLCQTLDVHIDQLRKLESGANA